MESLGDPEVLALLLSTGSRGEDALELSERLLYENGGFRGLREAAGEGLFSERGIKGAKALRIAAAYEIARRSEMSGPGKAVGPKELAARYGDRENEEFRLVLLNGRRELAADRMLSRGERLSFRLDLAAREAAKRGAKYAVAVHVHPSGIALPSPEDIASTRELGARLKAVGTVLLDHLVVAGRRYFSFSGEGIPF